jgi:hypothetical protein
VRLLHPGGLQVFEHHLPEILPVGAGLDEFVDQAVVLVTRDGVVWRQALDSERAGDADARVVGIGLFVEVLEFRLGGDRGVVLLLPADARMPPFGMQLLRRVGIARDFPLLPVLGEGGVESVAERFERLPLLLPNYVDLRVVGDRTQRDMWHPLVDEAMANVTMRWRFLRGLRLTSPSFLCPSGLSASR